MSNRMLFFTDLGAGLSSTSIFAITTVCKVTSEEKLLRDSVDANDIKVSSSESLDISYRLVVDEVAAAILGASGIEVFELDTSISDGEEDADEEEEDVEEVEEKPTRGRRRKSEPEPEETVDEVLTEEGEEQTFYVVEVPLTRVALEDSVFSIRESLSYQNYHDTDKLDRNIEKTLRIAADILEYSPNLAQPADDDDLVSAPSMTQAANNFQTNLTVAGDTLATLQETYRNKLDSIDNHVMISSEEMIAFPDIESYLSTKLEESSASSTFESIKSQIMNIYIAM